jgi:hypothetical protein
MPVVRRSCAYMALIPVLRSMRSGSAGAQTRLRAEAEMGTEGQSRLAVHVS